MATATAKMLTAKNKADLLGMSISLKSNSNLAIVRGLIVIITAILAWFAFSNAVVNVTRIGNPSLALQFAYRDAGATAATVDETLANVKSISELLGTESAAKRSLIGQAVNARALRQLGVVAEAKGDIKSARALVTLAAKMSRHDVGSQIWLINDAVSRENAGSALTHFDTALRTTETSSITLLPILIAATEEPSLIEPLANILKVAPPWRYPFYVGLIDKGPSAENMLRLYSALARTPGAMNREGVRGMIGRLIRDKFFTQAAEVYRNETSQNKRGAAHNGDFESDGDLQPLDWAYGDGDGVRGIRVPKKAGSLQQFALYYVLDSGKQGEIARQMVVLKPGRYQLSGVHNISDNDQLGSLTWQIICADTNVAVLNGSTTNPSLETRFVVPTSGCGAQWLILNARALDTRVSGWVDNIALTPL